MEIIVTSFLAFISSNIDDIFLLILFYLNPKFDKFEVVAGQLLGIISITAVSLAVSLLGLLVDKMYIGLFGLIPVYLGIRALWMLAKKEESEAPATIDAVQRRNSNTLAIAGITFANGGDNIGIYVPLFATLAWWEKVATVIVFLLMTLLWCLIAKYLTKHPYVASGLNKWGHVLTPFVLILLGIYILYESQSIKLLAEVVTDR
jgi:cadmium resistance protein CadD (predicted permease)